MIATSKVAVRAIAVLAFLGMLVMPAQPGQDDKQPARGGADLLPSWKDGKTKRAVVAFVHKVTDKSNSDYVPPAERIAVFDNDGTLWSEQPMYFQLAFALDRVAVGALLT